MNVLIDTNVLIWILDPKKAHNIGKHARHILDSPNSEVFISPLSITEMTIKLMLGKLSSKEVSESDLESSGLSLLPYTLHHAQRVSDLQSLARQDPLDRMLLAQALADNMVFLTADKTLLNMNLPNVVDAAV